MAYEEAGTQQVARRLLAGAVTSGRVAHAYLFLGPNAEEKEDAARWLAQGLNCATGPGLPCGSCPSCHLIAVGTHPDVRTVAPQGRFLRLDEVRGLTRAAYASPLTGRFKVYVLKAADRLLPEAANHLLKVLEEPPDDTVFILTADRSYAVLPTVASRCQVIPFRPLPPEQAARRLAAEGCASDLAHRAAYLAGGDLAAARGWTSTEGQRAQEVFLELVPRLPEGKGALVEAAETFAEDPSRYLTLLGAWYCDLLLWQDGRPELISFQGAEETLKRVAALYRPGEVVRANRAIEQAAQQLTGRSNVNTRLALLALLVELVANQFVGRRPAKEVKSPSNVW